MFAAMTFVTAEDARIVAKSEVAETSIQADPDVAPSPRPVKLNVAEIEFAPTENDGLSFEGWICPFGKPNGFVWNSTGSVSRTAGMSFVRTARSQ